MLRIGIHITEDRMDTNEVQDLNREKRRKRRRINRFLSIMVVVAFVAVIAVLGVFIYMKIAEMQKGSQHQSDVTEKLEELTGGETEVPVLGVITIV